MNHWDYNLPTFNLPLRVMFSAMTLLGLYLMVRYGWGPLQRWVAGQETRYDRVLRRQLLLDVSPRVIVWLNVAFIIGALIIGMLLTSSIMLSSIKALTIVFMPHLVIKHLEFKRRKKLETQLIDGLTTLASGVRAGLNLIQSMELLVENSKGPIEQEFSHILREYEMGMDLNQAMQSASNRIGSPLYRLTFTAIEMHRMRGGDSADSMDRLAESIREIHKLEGKLDAITAQGRAQANFMAVMPIVIIFMLLFIMPSQTALLFTEPAGRLMLLVVGALILGGYVWIRKIMQVDI